ncbi:uncharacterized protein LOC103708809 [Phoenix dactylifera]|uniref:Uncharacterized protein LOC103708809 n=1 Tax=Phoenix dactylifera TaxID=42345 RepID=A0A8B8J5C2_PHODC|nr:uncharacterized protein LOC103708809 [Phoenix dactylifera]
MPPPSKFPATHRLDPPRRPILTFQKRKVGGGRRPYFDAEGGLVELQLEEDLPHLFDEQEIDRSMYGERLWFRDPIAKHDTIDGYLFNIRLLELLFRRDFYVHHVRQTGIDEITTRWTVVMRFVLLPWKPELVFPGISIMGGNPQNQKFCSHAISLIYSCN